MKSNEGEEECNHFKNAVNGHRIIPIWLTFSFSPMITSVVRTKLCFQEATNMSKSRTETVYEFKSSLPIQNKRPSLNSLQSVGLKSILSIVTTVHIADI